MGACGEGSKSKLKYAMRRLILESVWHREQGTCRILPPDDLAGHTRDTRIEPTRTLCPRTMRMKTVVSASACLARPKVVDLAAVECLG